MCKTTCEQNIRDFHKAIHVNYLSTKIAYDPWKQSNFQGVIIVVKKLSFSNLKKLLKCQAKQRFSCRPVATFCCRQQIHLKEARQLPSTFPVVHIKPMSKRPVLPNQQSDWLAAKLSILIYPLIKKIQILMPAKNFYLRFKPSLHPRNLLLAESESSGESNTLNT